MRLSLLCIIALSGSRLAQPTQIELTPEEQAHADALVTAIDRDSFPSKERRKLENASIFLHLAATSTEEPVLLAALESLEKISTGSPALTAKRRLVDEAYCQVVRQHLASESPRVLERAITAAKHPLCMDEPDPKIVERLTSLAASDPRPAARLKALQALYQMHDFQKDPAIAAAFLQALQSDEPWLVGGALHRLNNRTHHLANAPEVLAQLQKLSRHEDPGVRGLAAYLTTWMIPDEGRADLGVRLHGMLEDDHPYVRGMAALGLGRLHRFASLPALLALLDDTTEANHAIPHEGLTGKTQHLRFSASPRHTVQATVLQAIEVLSEELPKEQRFKVGKIDYQQQAQDLAREADRARAWAKEHVNDLPTEE
jgi:HEAT repeat protein